MTIDKRVVGVYSENCYLIKKDNKGLIVDPGDEIDKIIDMIGDTKLVGILITHDHFDHVGALNELKEKIDVPVFYHNINNEINLSNLIDVEEKEYEIEDFKFEVIYTKGHRNDSVTYYFRDDKMMFTGDFLFYLSVGRTDFEYGDYEEMEKSIRKIKEYPTDTIIYPGHGTKTDLMFEIRYNSFLR